MSVFPWRRTAGVLLLQAGLGCQSTLYASTGDVLAGFTVEHVLPTLMSSSDVDLTCSTGLAFAGFLSAFARVTDPPTRASVVSRVSAGFCAEAHAREAELEGLRAVHSGRSADAVDSRIVEKRHRHLAARRFYVAYQQLQAAFGQVDQHSGAQCPQLESHDEPIYLLGLAAGVNAVLHDRASDGLLNVPMKIPAAVARAASCLDNQRWFGIPRALQAATWASVPGLAPAGTNVWESLEHAATVGESQGIGFARALQIQALGAAGKLEEQRLALSQLASARQAPSDNRDWQLLDAVGRLIALHESDKLWTEETGHRTPAGQLGASPPVADSSTASATACCDADDELLDGLLDTASPKEPAP